METVGFDLAPFDAPSGMAGTMKMAGVVPDGTTCDSAGRAPIMFETEHVIDPLVKFGDRVTAGQRIATVSTGRPGSADRSESTAELARTRPTRARHCCSSSARVAAKAAASSQARMSSLVNRAIHWTAAVDAAGSVAGAS